MATQLDQLDIAEMEQLWSRHTVAHERLAWDEDLAKQMCSVFGPMLWEIMKLRAQLDVTIEKLDMTPQNAIVVRYDVQMAAKPNGFDKLRGLVQSLAKGTNRFVSLFPLEMQLSSMSADQLEDMGNRLLKQAASLREWIDPSSVPQRSST